MGNYFLFEHPKSATSWKLKNVEEFMAKNWVIEVIAKMCQFGMRTTYKGEEGLVSKPRFWTNVQEVAKSDARKNAGPGSIWPYGEPEPEKHNGIHQDCAKQWLTE